MSEGIIYLRFRIMLLVGMLWADVLSWQLMGWCMTSDNPRQEETLWLAQSSGDFRHSNWVRPRGELSGAAVLIENGRIVDSRS